MNAPVVPEKVWWTARELAEARLPDLPTTQQNVERMAKRLDWRAQPGLARRRRGRGGGREYHWHLLPLRARRKLLMDAGDDHAATVPWPAERAEQHERYDALPETVKAKAREWLRVLQAVVAMEQSGLTRVVAVESMAAKAARELERRRAAARDACRRRIPAVANETAQINLAAAVADGLVSGTDLETHRAGLARAEAMRARRGRGSRRPGTIPQTTPTGRLRRREQSSWPTAFNPGSNGAFNSPETPSAFRRRTKPRC